MRGGKRAGGEEKTKTFEWRNAPGPSCLVLVLGAVVLGAHHDTSALDCTTVDDLDDVNELLLVCQGPVDLVVVTGPKIDHDVFVLQRGGNVCVRAKAVL